MSDIQEQRMGKRKVANGFSRPRSRCRCTNVEFPDILFEQIQAEALRRGWSFSKMVRHLCEASIEGIP